MSPTLCASSSEELWIPSPVGPIYAKLSLPEEEAAQKPLIVFSHEVGCTHRSGRPYAEHFNTLGCPFLGFDFRGGGSHSRSGADTERMSVLTELDDLRAVLDWVKTRPELAERPLVPLGASQGAFVTVLAAGERPEDFAALIGVYPALQIADEMRATFGSPEEIPARHLLHGWLSIGREYSLDVWDLDVYARMPDFPAPVLLLHGDEDPFVPLRYVERAARRFPDAELHVLPGAGHGFTGEHLQAALAHMDRFLQRIGLL